MKRTNRLLCAVSAIGLIGLGATPALAAGTTAGDSIVNNVTVDFQVGGVDQTEATASDTFVVDRKVNVTVSEVGGVTTPVSPGETQAVTVFQVQNLSNDVIDLDLSVAQPGTDDFDTTNVQIYIDENNDGLLDAGDTLVTYLDELAEDEIVQLLVVSDIPLTQANGDVAEVVLTADAHAGGGTGTLGAELTNTAGADTAGVDTVLADGAGDTDAAGDGAFSDTDSYTVSAANVTAAKTSVVISDPINGTTNPKAIPGAVVEYCIAVTNASGATATSVVVTDTLPADVTYDAAFGTFVDGTVDGGGVCQADGSSVGNTLAAGDVTGTLSDIAAPGTRTLYFRATIN